MRWPPPGATFRNHTVVVGLSMDPLRARRPSESVARAALGCPATKGRSHVAMRTVFLAVFILLAVLITACSGDGDLPTSTAGDGPATSVTIAPPETTQAPDTTAAPVDDASGIPTGVWVLLGVVMGAIGIGVFIGSSRSSDE